MKHYSNVQIGNEVTFPEWRGERHYMLPFTKAAGLRGPAERFQQTVDQMLDGVVVNPNQECYLMVDEKEVSPGGFHRRPGLHVDGYWHPGTKKHGGHKSISCHTPPRHDSHPEPGHKAPQQPSHLGWSASSEGLLLASNHTAARGLVGEYTRDFESDWRGGDCMDVSLNGMREILLQANRTYRMDVMTLHESLPLAVPVRRTVVRINVPGMQALR